MLTLTGKQRYWQAVTKARLKGQRDLRRFIAGELDWLPGIDERSAIIAEFDRLIEINSSLAERSGE